MEKIKRYPSIASLAIDARDSGAAERLSVTPGTKWFGGESPADSIRLAISGDTSRVADAERLLSQISAEIDVPERPWIADCAGAYPVVPDFLAGMPDCMRRRDTVESTESPVRIFYCPTASEDITAAQLMRRGCAVLALAIALSRSRPIELCVFNIGRHEDAESVIVAPINTAPLDLATAAYVMTSAGFVRRLCYNLARQHHWDRKRGSIAWPHDYGRADYLPGLLRRLGGNPETDVIIGPAYSADALINDPVAWVNAQVARLTGIAA
jgi:hypothetical protein